MDDLNVDTEGTITVRQLHGGTYNNGNWYAHRGGSIHVLGDIDIRNRLVIRAEKDATILMRERVTGTEVEITSHKKCNVNSDKLHVKKALSLDLAEDATVSLYLLFDEKITLTGQIHQGCTANLWVYAPYGYDNKVVCEKGGSFNVQAWTP